MPRRRDGRGLADLIDPEVKAVTALAGLDGFSEFDAVILCDVAALAPSQARLLAGFVEAGGGLLVAPGARANPAFLQRLAVGGRCPGAADAAGPPGRGARRTAAR